MKISSVKILGDKFRSLESNKLYSFNTRSRKERLSTKVFAGLNGSGKSNFLELFSEIFYFLEICLLDTVSDSEKSNDKFGFEIEYFLPKSETDIYLIFQNVISESYSDHIKNNKPLFKNISKEDFELLFQEELENSMLKTWKALVSIFLTNETLEIKVEKQLGEKPKYLVKRQDSTNQYWEINERHELLLPNKVIAYTSGQNEILSNPYLKLKYHYFKAFETKGKVDTELAENHRLFYLNYNTNFSIFVSNILLADEEKSKMLKNVLKINELQSFRITLNTEELYKKVIPINENLASNIVKLKKCATTWIEKRVGENNLLVLDFLINPESKAAFKFHFKTSYNLFKLFYELEIFNLYLVDKSTRNLMLQVHKSYNFSDEMPKPDPSRLVFRVEKIFINKEIENQQSKNLYYKALSDGEHQFNEIIGMILMMEQEGCLFLIDEPDTHFNPKWRAKLIKMLNYMAASSLDDKGNIEAVRRQEIILTTHSPFVISDSYTEDVYKFEKKNGIVSFENPVIQTYGTSITILLDEIFEKSETISEFAKMELKEMIDGITSKDDIRKIVLRLNTEFGDSVEKFDLFSKLNSIKNNFA